MTRSAIIYCRQSITQREEHISLDNQEAALRSLADELNLAVRDVIREPNAKGWDDARPLFEQAISRCVAERADLLVYDLSRFARRVAYQEAIIDRMEAHGLQVISRAEPWANQPLMRQVVGAFAEEQTRTIRRYVTDAMAAVAKQGRHLGPPPYGYRKQDGQLTVDAEQSVIVREIVERFLAGQSIHSLANAINDRGIRTRPSNRKSATNGAIWTHARIRSVLNSPTYAALVVHRGAVIGPGNWEPLITPEERARILARLSGPVVRRKTVTSWCEGLLYHTCGHRMTFGWHSSIVVFVCSYRKQVAAIRCHQPRAYWAPGGIELAARQCLALDLSRLATVDEVMASARRANGPTVSDRRADIAKRRDRAERRYTIAREMRLNEFETREWFETQVAAYRASQAILDAEEASLPTLPDPIQLAATRATLANLAPSVVKATDDQLRAIMTGRATIHAGAHGVRLRYAPDIAPLIPDPVTLTPKHVPRYGWRIVEL